MRRRAADTIPVLRLGRLARSLESPWWLVATVALATMLRAAHVLSLRATPWFDHLVVDPEYYDEWARRIAAGDWLGDRPFYKTGRLPDGQAYFRAFTRAHPGNPDGERYLARLVEIEAAGRTR